MARDGTTAVEKDCNMKKGKELHFGFVIILLVVVIWLCVTFFSGSTVNFDLTKSGTLGDSFGAVNSLFTGLAFAGVIISITLQRRDLDYTRQEIQKQKIIFSTQQFENTFFNLIKLHHSLAESITFNKAPSKDLIGRNAIKSLYDILCNEFIYTYDSDFTPNQNQRCLNQYYTKFFDAHGEHVGHFFRNLYHIVKFVHESDFSNIEGRSKQDYINILRAQLSRYELGILFFNCLSKYGVKKFKPLIEEYSLLEQFEKDYLRHDLLGFYDMYYTRAYTSEYERNPQSSLDFITDNT